MIKLFSTFNWSIPTTEAIIKINEVEYINKFFFDIPSKILARFESVDFKFVDIGGLNIFIKAGKNRNVEIKEIHSPIVIIHPKSITGLISLNTNDKKAHIVVNTAYKIGKKIDAAVFSSRLTLSVKPSSICMYLTR